MAFSRRGLQRQHCGSGDLPPATQGLLGLTARRPNGPRRNTQRAQRAGDTQTGQGEGRGRERGSRPGLCRTPVAEERGWVGLTVIIGRPIPRRFVGGRHQLSILTVPLAAGKAPQGEGSPPTLEPWQCTPDLQAKAGAQQIVGLHSKQPALLGQGAKGPRCHLSHRLPS